MKTIWIILIVIVGYFLLGPIMYGCARLNKVDPYIFEKSDEEKEKDIRSFLIVGVLSPLFVPLWLETKLIKKIKRKK